MPAHANTLNSKHSTGLTLSNNHSKNFLEERKNHFKVCNYKDATLSGKAVMVSKDAKNKKQSFLFHRGLIVQADRISQGK